MVEQDNKKNISTISTCEGGSLGCWDFRWSSKPGKLNTGHLISSLTNVLGALFWNKKMACKPVWKYTKGTKFHSSHVFATP